MTVLTNVFTASLRPRSPLIALYVKHLLGQRLAIAPQTFAEARYGALKAGWGQRRLDQLDHLVRRARTLPVDLETIDQVARLRDYCWLAGHPLHQSQEVGSSNLPSPAEKVQVRSGSSERPPQSLVSP